MRLLEASDLAVAYGDVQVLWDVSIRIAEAEIVTLLGPNGSGKSTLMNSLSRLLPLMKGEIWFNGTAVHELPAFQVIRLGIAHVLERHRLFPYMSVLENLLLGAGPKASKQKTADGLEFCYKLFPRLAERKSQIANSLSGGEQQMCAIARGLMSRPRLLMIDEPFIGLAPQVQIEVAEAIREINRSGVAILMIEQNVQEALKLSHRAYVLQAGHLVLSGNSSDLISGTEVEDVFFGRFEGTRIDGNTVGP